MERSSVRPVAPACGEIASWASTLSPLIDEIRQARPDTEPTLSKVDQLVKELTAISEAVYTVQDRLPWRGVKADEERWCLADISHLAYKSLDLIEGLKGCIRGLDVEKLPKRLEQLDTCIQNITSVMGGAIKEAAMQEGKYEDQEKKEEVLKMVLESDEVKEEAPELSGETFDQARKCLDGSCRRGEITAVDFAFSACKLSEAKELFEAGKEDEAAEKLGEAEPVLKRVRCYITEGRE